jgi:competence protein ComEA
LDLLPGIGPVLAERIVAYRTANGPFREVDDLAAVQGISPRMVEDLRPLVSLEP